MMLMMLMMVGDGDDDDDDYDDDGDANGGEDDDYAHDATLDSGWPRIDFWAGPATPNRGTHAFLGRPLPHP